MATAVVSPASCGPLKRWWHRRQRKADRDVMWTSLRQAARERYPDNEETQVLAALKGWCLFLQQPGQDHWHCPCAGEDDGEPDSGATNAAS